MQLNQYYEFDFDHPVETLWTLVSDTPRWREASGLPRYQAIPGFNQRNEPSDLSIRIGLHCGSSIAVTLNERLDYYGEAVNLAARMEGQGGAGDITMSASFIADPAIASILQDHQPQQREVLMKGFSNPVTIAQINLSTAHDKNR